MTFKKLVATLVEALNYMEKSERQLTINGVFMIIGMDTISAYNYPGVDLDEYEGDCEEILDQMKVLYFTSTEDVNTSLLFDEEGEFTPVGFDITRDLITAIQALIEESGISDLSSLAFTCEDIVKASVV